MIFVKPCSPDLDLSKEELTSVPVWVKLPNLKFNYLSTKTLNKMVSYIGNPLYTNKITAEQSRLSFARICVEVNVSSNLPKQIPYTDEHGRNLLQEVIYEWVPPKCLKCKTFGHASVNCPINLR
ncbi:hypothetical protein ACH5RR_032641 [Cinchona calisaya]|uniref:DUF4283 domain-containing protein n=1 Tax=Cinchona calisaya TaxID=153742 RepID=A0ABD2YL59_9GENT